MLRQVLLSAVLLLPLTALSAQATMHAKAHASPAAIVMMPDAITWGPAPAVLPAGATAAVLEGDPTKPGVFTMRLHMPDGYRIPPHSHRRVEHVTVISGTFNLGMGDKFDDSALHEFPTGAFIVMPKRMHHFAMAKGETIVQVHAMGPFVLNYFNPSDDPRKK